MALVTSYTVTPKHQQMTQTNISAIYSYSNPKMETKNGFIVATKPLTNFSPTVSTQKIQSSRTRRFYSITARVNFDVCSNWFRIGAVDLTGFDGHLIWSKLRDAGIKVMPLLKGQRLLDMAIPQNGIRFRDTLQCVSVLRFSSVKLTFLSGSSLERLFPLFQRPLIWTLIQKGISPLKRIATNTSALTVSFIFAFFLWSKSFHFGCETSLSRSH